MLAIMYFRNRYYNPKLGRFISRDPLGYIDSYGLYEAFAGNPFKYLDPLGERAISHLGVGGGQEHSYILEQEEKLKIINSPMNTDVKNAYISRNADGSLGPIVVIPWDYYSSGEADPMFGDDVVETILCLGAIGDWAYERIEENTPERIHFMLPFVAMVVPGGGKGKGPKKVTIDLNKEQIFYRDTIRKKSQKNIGVFNQTKSNTGEIMFDRKGNLQFEADGYTPKTDKQPINVVRTDKGIHIMQGNNRVYNAKKHSIKEVEVNEYTPEQWSEFSGATFDEKHGKTIPDKDH